MMSKKNVSFNVMAVTVFFAGLFVQGYALDVKKADAQYHSMCGCKSIFYYNRFEPGDAGFDDESGADGTVERVDNTEIPGSTKCDKIFTLENKSVILEIDPCLVLVNMNSHFCWLSGYYKTQTGKVFTVYAEYKTTGDWIMMSSITKNGVPYWNQFDYYFDFSGMDNVSQVRLRVASPDPGIEVYIDDIKICRYCDGTPIPPGPQLTALSVSAGTLNPKNFESDVPYYTVTDLQGVSYIQVKPVCPDASCTIYVNGTAVPTNTWSANIAVVDNKAIDIRVQKNSSPCIKSYYQITMSNPPLPDKDARLVNLTIDPGSVSPEYSIQSGQTAYNALVLTGTTSITVTPTVNNSSATITVNGTPVDNGTASGPITVSQGTTITIVVTAKDGVTQKTYTLTVAYPPVVVFTASTGSGTEAQAHPDPAITVSITPAPVAGQNIIVPFQVTSASTANEGQGWDYTIDKTPLHFGPGEQTKTINLTVLPHNWPLYWDRTIVLQLSQPSPAGAAILGDPRTFTYTISSNYVIVYVNSNVPAGTGNGLSWATGFTYFQQAMDYAKLHSNVLQIWVARGNYYTTGNPADRSGNYKDKHFQVKDLSNIAIYGGFPSAGGTWAQRDPINNPATLTGDLNNDDVFFANPGGIPSIIGNTENTRMVMEVDNCQNALLDGFVIQGANSGAGIYETPANKFLTVRNCRIYNNQSGTGGGFFFYHPFRLENCQISGNISTGEGGGGYVVNPIMENAYSGLIVNCLFSYNYSAGNGGALYLLGPSVEIINCTIAQNTASYNGGAIYNDWYRFGTPSREVKNCIIWGNSSISYPASPTCEIYNSPVPSGPPESNTGAVAVYYSDVRYIGSYGAISQNNIDADPLFVSGDYTLSQLSPCIDKGDQTLLPDGVETDAVGNPRVVDGDHDGVRQVDMGCYEQGASTGAIRYVRANISTPAIPGTDGAGKSWDNAYKYLQDALAEAQNNPGTIEEIRVAAGTYSPDADYSHQSGTGLSNSTFEMVENVAIIGGYPENGGVARDVQTNETILSGILAGNPANRAYHVVTGADNATIDGFTISDGLASVVSEEQNGGGMLNYYASPNIMNCTFFHNFGVSGGAMCNYYSNPTIIKCNFISNNAYGEGGGASGAIENEFSYPQISSCIFSYNTANNSAGAIENGDINPLTQLTIVNCLFDHNWVNIHAGAIFNSNINVTIMNCTFANNIAVNYPNAIKNLATGNQHSFYTITNSILWDDGNEIENNSQYGIAETHIKNSDVQGCLPHGTWNDSYGIDDGNNQDFDPLFGGQYPYSLTSDSPCIDAGTDEGAPTTDILGNTRSGVPDMGAYEYIP
jgi:hypothetical protein